LNIKVEAGPKEINQPQSSSRNDCIFFPRQAGRGEIDTAKFLLLELGAARRGKPNYAYNALDG